MALSDIPISPDFILKLEEVIRCCDKPHSPLNGFLSAFFVGVSEYEIENNQQFLRVGLVYLLLPEHVTHECLSFLRAPVELTALRRGPQPSDSRMHPLPKSKDKFKNDQC